MSDHCSPRRDGFTLIEVLIVVTLMGVLAVAIAGVFSVVVRTLPSTEARADDARSLLGISTWLPSDVSATPRAPLANPQDLNPTNNWYRSPGLSGCSGAAPGINLLRLQHRESVTGAPQNFFVSYRLVDSGETSNIIRVTCVNGGTPAINNVTSGLPPSSQSPVTVTWKRATDLGVEYVIGVEMEITTFAGDTLRVDASSWNPNQTLSTIPDAVTTTIDPNTTTTTTAVTTTTTTTTTTAPTTTTTGPSVPPSPNQPPTAAAVSGSIDPGGTLNIALAVNDPNGDALAVTLNNVPGGWIATPPSGAVTTPITVRFTPPIKETSNTYLIDYTVTDPSGASASSKITIEVRRVPCAVSSASINPNPVRNTVGGNGNGNGNGNQVGPLERAVTVTVTKSGNCSELALRYTRVESSTGNQASVDDRQPRIDLFGDSVTVTFRAISTERWQKGNRRIELVEFPGLPNEIIHQFQQMKVD